MWIENICKGNSQGHESFYGMSRENELHVIQFGSTRYTLFYFLTREVFTILSSQYIYIYIYILRVIEMVVFVIYI